MGKMLAQQTGFANIGRGRLFMAVAFIMLGNGDMRLFGKVHGHVLGHDKLHGQHKENGQESQAVAQGFRLSL